MLPLPRRSKVVRLSRYCRDSLLRRVTARRATCAHRYDMLPRRQAAIVGLTFCDRSHPRTIYHHREDGPGPKFGASLDGQVSRRTRRPCTSRLASCECEVGKRNNKQATNRIVVFFHATDYFSFGITTQVPKRFGENSCASSSGSRKEQRPVETRSGLHAAHRSNHLWQA